MKTTLLTLLLLPFVGCASMVNGLSDGHPNRKKLEVPSSAKWAETWTGIYFVQKPPWQGAFVVLPRGDGAFRGNHGYLVDEKGSWVADIRPRFNWWTLGNIFLSGPLPWAVDFVDGAAFDPQIIPAPKEAAPAKK